MTHLNAEVGTRNAERKCENLDEYRGFCDFEDQEGSEKEGEIFKCETVSLC
jgi:hypothetical protein